MTDLRNRLNALSNRDFLRATKSFWLSEAAADDAQGELLEQFCAWLRETRGEEGAAEALGQLCASRMWSQAPPRGGAKSLHPATFSERDIERILCLFTHPGDLVLDPFVGSGSTLLAARACGRPSLGLELIPRWARLARERLRDTASGDGAVAATVRQTDALRGLGKLAEGSVDFVVTSPPYWQILRKKPGMKAAAERTGKGLPTHYSEDPRDLGNVRDYAEFLERLGEVFGECGRVLKPQHYLCAIVSDFRDGPRFVLFHADLAAEVERRGLALKGLTVLLQDNKNLYPFGIPYHFVSNIHHQYVLIFQKPDPAREGRKRHAD